jgi:hypothetical protein
MKRYRSKPTEIEAYRMTHEVLDAHILDQHELPGVTVVASNSHPERRLVHSSRQYVTTAQGQKVYVEPGEWIVKEPDGSGFYPISDAIFASKYSEI